MKNSAKKSISLFLLMFTMVSLFCPALYGCKSEGETGEIAPELNPNEDAAAEQSLNVSLYFSDPEYSMLLPEVREISVPVSKKEEYTVLEELIAGPVKNKANFMQVINPDTQIIKIFAQSGVLSVILSDEFLDWSFITSSPVADGLASIKRLAVYSIVNTLIEVGGYSKVHLLVDREGSRTGQRIKLEEVGMGESGILEPLGRNAAVVQTPGKVLKLVLEALSAKDYKKLYKYVAEADREGDARPEEGVFISWIQEKNYSVEDFSIVEMVDPTNLGARLFMINYSLSSQSGGRKTYENFPLTLIRVNGCWKVEYSSLESLLE